jgi:hypothetical protein
MGKYAKYQRKPRVKKGMNPIWRGIGCILLAVVPVIAYGLMLVFVPLVIATGKVPYKLLGHIIFPEWVFKVPTVGTIASYISSIENLWTNLIIFFVILLILTGVSSLLYSMVYSLVGPARYSELDAPPSKHKGKVYTR